MLLHDLVFQCVACMKSYSIISKEHVLTLVGVGILLFCCWSSLPPCVSSWAEFCRYIEAYAHYNEWRHLLEIISCMTCTWVLSRNAFRHMVFWVILFCISCNIFVCFSKSWRIFCTCCTYFIDHGTWYVTRHSSMFLNYVPCCVCSHWSHYLDLGLMPHILHIQVILQICGLSILRYVFLDLLLMQCMAKG
jgi:hypothetical protein